MGGRSGGGGRAGRSGGGGSAPSTESILESYADQIFSEMSRAEAKAIDGYQGGEFASITHRLVTGERDRTAEANIAQIDAVMRRSSIPTDATVYRGMSGDAAAKMMGKSPKEGKVFKAKNFVSTSLDKDRASGFGWTKSAMNPSTPQHLLEIKVPKGSKGIYMKNSFEKELLLNRGTKFKITGTRTETRMAKDYKGADVGTSYLKVTTVEVIR